VGLNQPWYRCFGSARLVNALDKLSRRRNPKV